MKKYFAKYLPIEGEIKVGDFFLEEYINGEKNVIFNDGNLLLLAPRDIVSNRKKLKLFLCSRDIQVGDTFSYIPPGNHLTLEQKATEDTIEALKTMTIPYWKVIGEISPAAVWVKEGDEFDEEDIQKNFRLNKEGSSVFMKKFIPEHTPEFEKTLIKVYKIKCPTCKTFH